MFGEYTDEELWEALEKVKFGNLCGNSSEAGSRRPSQIAVEIGVDSREIGDTRPENVS